jgi:DNA-binding Lrp family transcriptional regulator
VKTDQLDEVDHQLVHALMLAPRASFRQLAGVLEVSDQTVARRYRRLAETAGLRVFGLIDAPRAGWVNWLVRLQTAPGSAQRIADSLAQRSDTRWVRLYSGGAELVFSLQARSPEQRNTLFLRGLPGSRHVTTITAQSVLHVFTPVAYVGYSNALSAAQLAALRQTEPLPLPLPLPLPEPEPELSEPMSARGTGQGGIPASSTMLRAEDDLLIDELARDGRTSVADLAAATHWHESTVRRRIEELRQAGLLYFDLDIDETVLGINANVMLWLKVEPASLDAAGRAVAAHPEVPFAAATTGPTNLTVSAIFRDNRHLYRYLTSRLADLPGLQSVETTPMITTVKRVGRRDATD